MKERFSIHHKQPIEKKRNWQETIYWRDILPRLDRDKVPKVSMDVKCIPDDIEHRRNMDDLSKKMWTKEKQNFGILITFEFDNFHSLIIFTSANEFHSSIFELFNICWINFITMSMTFINWWNISIEFAYIRIIKFFCSKFFYEYIRTVLSSVTKYVVRRPNLIVPMKRKKTKVIYNHLLFIN